MTREGWRYLAELLRRLRQRRGVRLFPEGGAEELWPEFRDAVMAASEEVLLEEPAEERPQDAALPADEVTQTVDPVDPVDPADPLGPLGPFDPVDPLKPADPVDEEEEPPSGADDLPSA